MKFLLPFLCFFCLTISSIHAQLSLGIKAGVNLADQNIKNLSTDIKSEQINGFVLGAFLEIPLGGIFYFQPEFTIIQKGNDLQLEGRRTKINYIDVPLLLKIKIINSSAFNLNILGGPSYGHATDGTIKEGNSTVDIEFLTGEFKRFDLGLHAGAGVGLNLGPVGIFGDVRYLFGLSNISDKKDVDVKNQGIALTAGLVFRLSGGDK